jgi:hypothetical protein
MAADVQSSLDPDGVLDMSPAVRRLYELNRKPLSEYGIPPYVYVRGAPAVAAQPSGADGSGGNIFGIGHQCAVIGDGCGGPEGGGVPVPGVNVVNPPAIAPNIAPDAVPAFGLYMCRWCH